jgi:hypothetical protein
MSYLSKGPDVSVETDKFREIDLQQIRTLSLALRCVHEPQDAAGAGRAAEQAVADLDGLTGLAANGERGLGRNLA